MEPARLRALESSSSASLHTFPSGVPWAENRPRVRVDVVRFRSAPSPGRSVRGPSIAKIPVSRADPRDQIPWIEGPDWAQSETPPANTPRRQCRPGGSPFHGTGRSPPGRTRPCPRKVRLAGETRTSAGNRCRLPRPKPRSALPRSPPLGFPGTRGAGSTSGQRLPAKAAGSRKTVWPDAEMRHIDAFTYGYHDVKEHRYVSRQKFPVSRVFCV